MQNNILAGRTVVELGTMVAAPFATHILSQLGATIIKIEPPGGDPTRNFVRGGPSGTYIAYSRGKESLCLDLRSENGNSVLKKLLVTTDVIVHNLSPGSARRLKVTYEDCLQANPDIVYCHVRGYGPGPLAEELASNPVAEAATGVMYDHRIDGRPSRLGPSYHDQFAGCYAVIGILGALLGDRGTPGSRRVEFGLYETGLHIAARDLVGLQLKTQLTGKVEQEPSGEFSMPGYGAYETSDGRWIYLVMLTDEHWRRFWGVISTFDEVDPALSTLRQRKKQRTVVENLVKSAVQALTFDEVARRLSSVGFGFTEVLPPEQVLNAPQARSPRKFTNFVFQGYEFEAPDFPINTCSDKGRSEIPPALLGEHTREILNSLGYDQAQCDALIQSGVASVPSLEKPVWTPVCKSTPLGAGKRARLGENEHRKRRHS